MLTESVGGHCPVCNYDRMLLRYGSQGYYCFDACPRCSFAHASNDYNLEHNAKELWDDILVQYGFELDRLGLPRHLSGIKQWMDAFDSNHLDDAIETTVFRYSKDDLQNPEFFLLPIEEVEKITGVKIGANDEQ